MLFQLEPQPIRKGENQAKLKSINQSIKGVECISYFSPLMFYFYLSWHISFIYGDLKTNNNYHLLRAY